jgi:hypothetical protein
MKYFKNQKRFSKKITILNIIVFCVFILFAFDAKADMGLPMIVIVWPGAWVLLLPIILIEAIVAHRILNLVWSKSIKVSAMTNAVSTIAGIPITWLFLALPLWGIGAIGFLSKLPKWLSFALMLPFYALWLPPMPESQEWLIPLSALILCIPFFYASVRIETRVAGKMLKEVKSEDIRFWVWKANIYSYGFICLLLLGCMVWLLLKR